MFLPSPLPHASPDSYPHPGSGFLMNLPAGEAKAQRRGTWTSCREAASPPPGPRTTFSRNKQDCGAGKPGREKKHQHQALQLARKGCGPPGTCCPRDSYRVPRNRVSKEASGGCLKPLPCTERELPDQLPYSCWGNSAEQDGRAAQLSLQPSCVPQTTQGSC